MCWILGLAQSGDAELWSFTVENKFALISKDYDFLHFLERTAPDGQLIRIRVWNCRRQDLLEVVERVWPETLALVSRRAFDRDPLTKVVRRDLSHIEVKRLGAVQLH